MFKTGCYQNVCRTYGTAVLLNNDAILVVVGWGLRRCRMVERSSRTGPRT